MTLFYLSLIIAISILSLCLILILYRFFRGPDLPDRVTAFDLFASCVISMMAIYAVITGSAAYLDVAIILSLITFLGSMSFSYYIMKKHDK
jgi:multisubunit Na+/H+ antiporter MnhF subunit